MNFLSRALVLLIAVIVTEGLAAEENTANSSALESNARQGTFFAGLELGQGRVDLDDNFATFQDDRNANGLASAAGIGYQWHNNLIVEANIAAIDEVDVFEAFDDININEFSTFVGYSFEVSPKFKIIPMIGVNRWEIKATEGRFLNPGDEDSATVRGTDFIYKIKFQVPIRSNIHAYLSHSEGEYDYIDSNATRLGIRIDF